MYKPMHWKLIPHRGEIMKPLLLVPVTTLLLALTLSADDAVRVVKDLDYIADNDYADNKDKLDLYLPDHAADFPVVVFFHGGGLRAGDKNESAHVGQALARTGIGAAVVNYRLSPGISHPMHIEDAARALAWVYRHIDEYGGDHERIHVSGHSAGAYLASLLTLDERYLKGVSMNPGQLAGAIPISGFFYVEEVAPDRPTDVWGDRPSDWRAASPNLSVTANTPPILLLYADGDDPWRREQNERLATTLSEQGHEDVDVVEITHRDHIGIWKSLAPGDATLRKLAAFVETRKSRDSSH